MVIAPDVDFANMRRKTHNCNVEKDVFCICYALAKIHSFVANTTIVERLWNDTMKLDIYQIDAFASKVFRGNPAAVVPLAEWLPDDVMQNIAAENNLAETAFFVPLEEGNYDLRWFTPEIEIPLCGHATLASAFVLYNYLGYKQAMVGFQSKSGELRVSKSVRNGRDLFTLDFPVRGLERIETPQSIINALGITPRETYRSAMNYLVVLESPREVLNLTPDFSGDKTFFSEHGIIVSAAVPNSLSNDQQSAMQCDVVDFVSRYFAVFAGVFEDPVTGSAHCTLVPYWAEKLGKTTLIAQQVSKRGGQLFCELRGDRVMMGGHGAAYLQGTIEV